ncbi:hypothetical protein AKJ16_DCAP12424 [Drosera capensis]
MNILMEALDPLYSITSYEKTYELCIYPVPSSLLTEGASQNDEDVLPLSTSKQPGRPKKKRFRSSGERYVLVFQPSKLAYIHLSSPRHKSHNTVFFISRISTTTTTTTMSGARPGGGGAGGMFRMAKRVSRTVVLRAQLLRVLLRPRLRCRFLSVSAAASHGGVWQLGSGFADEFDWEYLDNVGDGNGGKGEKVCEEDVIFGAPPSEDEVKYALASLQEVFRPAFVGDVASSDQDMEASERAFSPAASIGSASPRRSELDWIEPPWQLYDGGRMQANGVNSVFDALYLCETEPIYQNMVVSLSSDQKVWEAVMKNEVVREMTESLKNAKKKTLISSGDSQGRASSPAGVLSWIFENMKAKFMKAVANITNLVGGLYENLNLDHKSKTEDEVFQQQLKTSFMLTILVLFVVVVDRAKSAP